MFALCLALLCVCGTISVDADLFPYIKQLEILSRLTPVLNNYLNELYTQESLQFDSVDYKSVEFRELDPSLLQYDILAIVTENNREFPCVIEYLRSANLENCANFDVKCGSHKYSLKKRSDGCNL